MAVRFNMQMSDDLDKAINKVSEETEVSKSEIIRKALQLYLAAEAGKRQGKKIGIANPETNMIEQEFIGL